MEPIYNGHFGLVGASHFRVDGYNTDLNNVIRYLNELGIPKIESPLERVPKRDGFYNEFIDPTMIKPQRKKPDDVDHFLNQPEF